MNAPGGDLTADVRDGNGAHIAVLREHLIGDAEVSHRLVDSDVELDRNVAASVLSVHGVEGGGHVDVRFTIDHTVVEGQPGRQGGRNGPVDHITAAVHHGQGGNAHVTGVGLVSDRTKAWYHLVDGDVDRGSVAAPRVGCSDGVTREGAEFRRRTRDGAVGGAEGQPGRQRGGNGPRCDVTTVHRWHGSRHWCPVGQDKGVRIVVEACRYNGVDGDGDRGRVAAARVGGGHGVGRCGAQFGGRTRNGAVGGAECQPRW